MDYVERIERRSHFGELSYHVIDLVLNKTVKLHETNALMLSILLALFLFCYALLSWADAVNFTRTQMSKR